MNHDPLYGKNVLITGSAKRVGAALVRAFAAAGAGVMIHCSKSRQQGRELLAEIGGSEKGHSLCFFDFTAPEDIAAFWNTLPVQPDILINNASVFSRMTLRDESLSAAKQQLDVNFWAPVEMMRQMALRTSEHCEKQVINMLDQAITKTAKDSFSYAVSKKALAEATRIAALQFAPSLRVNGICPGPVLPPEGLEHLKMQKTLSTLPLGRPVALDDLCQAALFLASNRSMTGSFVYVDCGQNLL